jgi:hypothetical protein
MVLTYDYLRNLMSRVWQAGDEPVLIESRAATKPPLKLIFIYADRSDKCGPGDTAGFEGLWKGRREPATPFGSEIGGAKCCILSTPEGQKSNSG